MLPKLLLRFFGGLKFPWLFAITAALFAGMSWRRRISGA